MTLAEDLARSLDAAAWADRQPVLARLTGAPEGRAAIRLQLMEVYVALPARRGERFETALAVVRAAWEARATLVAQRRRGMRRAS